MTPDPSDVVVRVAGEADIAAIASLRSLWTGDVERDPEFEDRMAGWLAGEGERRTTWLAAVGDLPVGMASLFEYRRMPKPGHADSRWGYVGNMFVRVNFRNRGIGSGLLAALIAAADERSYARLVVSPSTEASSLYRGGGFILPGGAGGSDVLLVRPGPLS
jgi:GNAT superfamily N-acetyltransferase